MRNQASVEDGNTFRGTELAESLLNFPLRQCSFHPLIIGDNGVVNLFKATRQPAGRGWGVGRVEPSNNPVRFQRTRAVIEWSSALTAHPLCLLLGERRPAGIAAQLMEFRLQLHVTAVCVCTPPLVGGD